MASNLQNEEAVRKLCAFLGKTLRVHTTDARMFVGTLKCTDKDRNVILAVTHEYRQPTEAAVGEAASDAGASDAITFRLPLTSRFVGQVVVPGRFITKIEVME